MDFVRTKIHDIVIISPKVYGDGRGFFLETFREDLFSEFGITSKFVQDNHCKTDRAHGDDCTIKGIYSKFL